MESNPILVAKCVELEEDDLVDDENYKKNVAIPYFKDIYKDLVSQAKDKLKGVDENTMLQYLTLPGYIGERFFAVMDLSKSGCVDLREFVHGLFKVFYSTTETKIKLSFDM